MNLGLVGKVALITGGSHGIGLATAVNLAREGCDIAICSRTKLRLHKAKNLIEAVGMNCFTSVVDVHNQEDIVDCISSVMRLYGHIDILINNVGGGGRWGTDSFENTDESVWLEVFEKNTMAAVSFTKLVVPNMRKRKWGRVITVTSTLGKQGGGRPWFNVAKAAQTAFMKNLSLNKELVRDGITFNCVAPGCIMIPDTGWAEMANNNYEEFRAFEDNLPFGRLGTPEEVASVITFLCGEQASLVNGGSIAVDGAESVVF